MEGITEAPVRRPVADSLRRLGFGALAAAFLPVAAHAGDPPAPAPADGAACRVPPPGGSAPVPPLDLTGTWARLAAEAPRARAEGYRPLNTRGYNYAVDARGLEQAALSFEAGRQGQGAP